MRLKIATAAMALVLAVAAVYLVAAALVQEEHTTGNVTVIGDLVATNPGLNWLSLNVFASDGAPVCTRPEHLMFTNASGNPATLVGLARIDETPAPPNELTGHLTLEIGVVIGTVCEQLEPVPWAIGEWYLELSIPTDTPLIICGVLCYDGTYTGAYANVDLDFVFETSTTMP